MDKQPSQSIPVTETQLVALLTTLRVEQTPEADFESRFLAEFHDRVAREAVCCPARRHLLAHLMQMLQNVGTGRFAVGASALGLGVLAVGYVLFPTAPTGADTVASVVQERSAAPLLLPALSHDLAECTTVRVTPMKSVFEIGGVTVTRGGTSTVVEFPHVYTPATRGSDSLKKSGQRTQLPSSSARYAF